MKSHLSYILRRVVAAVLVVLVLAAVKKASAQTHEFNFISRYYGSWTYASRAQVTVINPSSSPVTLRAATSNYLAATPATGNPVGSGSGAVYFQTVIPSNLVIPAGGSALVAVSINCGSSGGLHNATWRDYSLTHLQFVEHTAGATLVRPLNQAIPFSTRWYDAPQVLNPAGVYELGQLYLSDPPPRVLIKVQADAQAAGPPDTRSYSIGDPGEIIPTILVEGFNTLVDGYDPQNYSGTVRVYQNGFVIGQGLIEPDQWGNIDLTVQANGSPVTARTIVNAPAYMSGDFKLEYEGKEGIPLLFSFPAGGTFEHVVDDPFNYPPGIEIRVFMMTDPINGDPGEWVRVGTSTLVKDSLGGWEITVPLSGPGDPPKTADAAAFSLDVLSYDPGTQSITLEINGETIVASPSQLTGSPGSGSRTVFTVNLDNSDGRYSGKPYSWKITGMLEGAPVSGKTLAQGTTPQGVSIPGDLNEVDNAFVIADNSTVGNPDTPPVPMENTYDPAAPLDPESPRYEQQLQQREAYQAQRKAISDESMLNDNVSSPNEGEATDLANRMIQSTKALADAATDVGEDSAAPQTADPSTIGMSPTLTITLPYFAPFTIDSRNYGNIGPNLRTVLLGCLAFTAALAGTKIVSAAFAVI